MGPFSVVERVYIYQPKFSRMFRFISICILSLGLMACSQSKKGEIPVGKIMTIQEGTVVKVKEIMLDVESEGSGAFAGMAASTAEAITPGFLAQGTTKIASATGSLMDSNVEVERYVKVRILMDNTNELVEIIQKEQPGLRFRVGQKAIITKGSTPGNVWPD